MKSTSVCFETSVLFGWSLIEFDQHVAGLDVRRQRNAAPHDEYSSVESRIRAPSVPPASVVFGGTVTR